MCSICLIDNILDVSILDCGHQYCKNCIDEWFNKGKNSCPICRKDILYFKNNNENFRLIIKNNESIVIHPELLIRYIRCQKIIRGCFVLFSLMLYYIYNQNNYNKYLLNKYDNCYYNYTNVLTTLLVKGDSLVKCTIPINYFNNC